MRSIEQIRRANASSPAPYWFEPGAMRFFETRVGRTVYGGRFFTTTERAPSNPRRASIRCAMPDGSIETVGEFMGYADTGAARRAIQAGLRAGIALRECAGSPGRWAPHLGALPIGVSREHADAARLTRALIDDAA